MPQGMLHNKNQKAQVTVNYYSDPFNPKNGIISFELENPRPLKESVSTPPLTLVYHERCEQLEMHFLYFWT